MRNNISANNFKKIFSIGLTATLLMGGFFVFSGTASAAATITSVNIDGGLFTAANQGATMPVTVFVSTSGSDTSDDWKSTAWRIGLGSFLCANTDNHTQDGSYNETFNITAPLNYGTYNAEFIAYNSENCSTGAGNTFTLTNSARIYYPPTGNDSGGSFSNPGNAFTSNNQYASEDTNGRSEVYKTFNLPAISSGSTITGIEVDAEGYREGTVSKSLNVSISWDGGTNFTSAKNTGDLNITPDKTVTLGNSSDNWGRTWSPSEFSNSNFKIKVTAVTTGSSDINLDYLQVKVYYTSAPTTGTLTVIKHVVNDNGGTAVASNWTMDVTATNPSNNHFAGSEAGVAITLNAGSYSVDESGGVSGYTKTLSADCSGTIAGGESKTCTITNNDVVPQLTVIKHVINDNGGTAVAGNFTMNVTGTNVSSPSFAGAETPGTTVTLNQGAYSVDESVFAGYAKTLGTDCSGTINVGETKTCTITNDDNAPSLTLDKVVVNDNGGTATESAWTLTATGPTTLSGPGATGSTDVVSDSTFSAGTYTLSELGPDGYAASDWVCVGGIQNGNEITLGLGENITCTITNDDIAPTLTLEKTIVNLDGGTATEADFQGKIDENDVDWNVAAPLLAGNHTASELAGVTGYAASSWGGDCNLDGTITLAPGENATCTITNDDIAPGLTLNKIVTTDNGGTETDSDFQGYIDGDPVAWGDAQILSAGTYTLTEDGPSGYEESDWLCVGGGVLNGNEVTIGLEETVVCTITNNDIAPSLTIIKHVENNYGGTATADNWTMDVTATNPSNNHFAGSEAGVAITLDAGSYSVDESGEVSGYTKTLGDNCSGTIAIGESKTCTITNDDIQPKLTVTKVVVNDNGGSKVIADFPLFVGETPVTSGVQNGFNAGAYTISETQQREYAATISGDCDANGAIALAPGDVKSCTITNDDIAPKLTVIKHVINDNSGTKTASDFTINVTGTNVSQGSFPGNAEGTIITLDAGQYSVDENTASDYTKTLSEGCSGAIAVGETKICTITNDDIAVAIGGGGGGGGSNGPPGIFPSGLAIQNETFSDTTENSVTITWTTNHPATSYVIYAMEGEKHTLDFNDTVDTPPKYGYERSTSEYDTPANINGVLSHSVIVSGLTPGTTYYYRTVSRGSLSVSEERSFTTLTVEQAAAKASGQVAVVASTSPTTPTPPAVEVPAGTTSPAVTAPAAAGNLLPAPSAQTQTAEIGVAAATGMVLKDISQSFLKSILVILALIILIFLIAKEISRKRKKM